MAIEDIMRAGAMAIAACEIFVEEHEQTYDGEPMSLEMYKALETAKRALKLYESVKEEA